VEGLFVYLLLCGRCFFPVEKTKQHVCFKMQTLSYPAADNVHLPLNPRVSLCDFFHCDSFHWRMVFLYTQIS